jgi:hypothetical protein
MKTKSKHLTIKTLRSYTLSNPHSTFLKQFCFKQKIQNVEKEFSKSSKFFLVLRHE